MELRPYQVQAVAELRDCYRRGARAPLYQLPTGGGKTVVFCHISEGATKRGKSVWIVVHRQELLYQCSRALEGLGVMHGLIAPGFTPGIEHVQVASVQTLVKRLDSGRAAPPDLIVLDEAHHATAGSWRKIIEACPNSRLLGVTATPVRLDGQGLGVAGGGVFDALVSGPTIPELIAQGFLSPPVVYAPPTQLDLSGVRMVGGDYAQGEIGRRMDKPTITGDVVAHYRRICNGAPAIAFCASVEHAKHVAADFRGAGFRAESLDGKMPDGQRKTLIDELGRGHLNVLTSCDIVSEGTDIPVVMAAILLRPTASMGLYLQQVGRALRPAPGKTRAVILDHVGNCLRHGLPDEDREWSLAGVVRRSREGNLRPPGEDPAVPTVLRRPCAGPTVSTLWLQLPAATVGARPRGRGVVRGHSRPGAGNACAARQAI